MNRLRALVLTAPLRRLLALVAAPVLTLTACGVVWGVTGERGSRWIGLDSEVTLWPLSHLSVNLPAIASGFTDFAAALLWALVAATVAPTIRWARVALGFLSAFVAWMGVDELVGVHEDLERWTGIDWQVLYVPVVLAGGVGTLLTFAYLWKRGVRLPIALFTAGGISWFVAQVLEHFEWIGPHGDQRAAHWMAMTQVEENGEILGSALFAVAAIVALRALVEHRRGHADASAEETGALKTAAPVVPAPEASELPAEPPASELHGASTRPR